MLRKKESQNATANPLVPRYNPDGCGAILLFHTPDHQIYGLGGLRNNPALADKLTNDGKPFPAQINTTIGGKLFDANKPLDESIINAIKYKMFYESSSCESPAVSHAQQIISALIEAIKAPQGWGSYFCVHTDSWKDKNDSIGTMCFITGIKHINCTFEDLEKIESAFETIMNYKKSQGEAERNLSNFKFYPFLNTMRNATIEYLITRTELEKAEVAYSQKAFVTFNDLCLEAHRINNSFSRYESSVDLTLPNEDPALIPSL